MRLLDVEIWATDRDTVRDWVRTKIDRDELTLLTFANAHTLNLHHRTDSENWLDGFTVLPDGIGIELAAKMRKSVVVENLNGTDLVPWLLANPPRPITVFLYGDTAETNERTVEHIRQRYPDVTVVGSINGFVDDETAVKAILAAPPADILLVGTGQPKQERFLRAHAPELEHHVHMGIGVGALFAFMAGRVTRAPEIVRMIRLEWAWRLAQEPRRLFTRYVVGNVTFLYRAARSARRERVGTPPRNS